MRQTADVVIVGGGVMGASAAWWLLGMSPGLKVTVIERDPTYAQAATALSVASVRSQFSNPVNVMISRFGVEFIRNFGREMGEAGGVPSLGLKENGYLFLTGTETGAATMEELAAMQRGLGAATAVLSQGELAARYPWMRLDDVVAGSLGLKDEGWFDNMGLLGGFRRAARARGAEFVAAEARALIAGQGGVAGVTLTTGEEVKAGQVLVAAGTRTPGLLAGLGIEWPVEPRKRTVFVAHAPKAEHPEAPLVIDHAGVYFRPEHDAWITATVPDVDPACSVDDFEPDHAQFEDLVWPRLWNRAEGFAETKVRRFWVGQYDFNTLDQNAILGGIPGFGNLYVANGFSGHGLQQAPAVGRGLAELMLTGGWRSIDLSPLDVTRVMEGRPFLEKAIV